MYIMNYIDRNALPQARVQGLKDDLGLVGSQYNIVLSVTFIGYILMQVPSNMMLGLFRPSWYISVVMVAWGICFGAEWRRAQLCWYRGLQVFPWNYGVSLQEEFPTERQSKRQQGTVLRRCCVSLLGRVHA